MNNFWDYSVWGSILLIAVLMGGLLAGNLLKKQVAFLRVSLIPTSVIGGTLLLILGSVYKLITGNLFFDTPIFNGNGYAFLEILTYHCLALGFIASTLKVSENKLTKKRSIEIFDTGVTTVSSYLIQAIFGLGITLVAAKIISGFFPAAGIILPFGFGQGTGQAMNYGGMYEAQYGFVGGKNFGLTIAALGFISAAIGGVIYLNVLRKQNRLPVRDTSRLERIIAEDIQAENEIPMQDSIDKMTIQIAFIGVTYFVAYLMMYCLGNLLPGLKAIIYGFNFLLGVIAAVILKGLMNFFRKKGLIQKRYTNNFLMTRASNLFFDIMVTAGIAAIRLDMLEDYWGLILILAVVGAFATFFYNRFVARAIFPEYQEEQLLAMYGMLTGTASTGVILLREIDPDFSTPAADNLVYQTMPAIVFGFPMMIIATMAPVAPVKVYIIIVAYFIVLNLILFRRKIFKRNK